MRIFLLNPNIPTDNFIFPLGLGYIAAVLEKEGHEVMAIDANAPYRPYSNDELKVVINDFKPQFIGVTMSIAFITRVYSLAKELSELNIPLVAGGPHANCLPEEVLSNYFDIVVIGEGEGTITDLVEYFKGNKPIDQIRGIGYRKNGKIIYNPPRDLIEDIDDIAFPSRKHFPLKNYTGLDNPESLPYFWTMLSSRGCPFNCIFCSSHNIFGRKYRIRSAENVFQEIEYLKENYDVPMINFVDDEITVDKKRLVRLCELLIESKLDIKLHGRARITSVTEDMLKKMKRAGFSSVSYGVESGDQETLNRIKKLHRVEEIKKGIEITSNSGIDYFSINNIIGFPWETERHINNTIKMNKLIPRKTICTHYFNVPIPYPGTELYNKYYKEFSFKQWWLDEKNFEHRVIDNVYRPFYKKHMSFLSPFYLVRNFFRYSPDIKKKIVKSFTYFGRTANAKIYGRRKEFIVNFLSRLSLLIYRINPHLERMLFSFLINPRFKKIAEKFLCLKGVAND